MTTPVAQPGIERVSPYAGGESAKDGINLASNENPYGPGQAARKAYAEAANRLNLYPDGSCARLRAAIASVHQLDEARIVCGCGSDELLGMLAHSYAGAGDEVVHCAHGFLMYRISALAAGAEPVSVDERGLRTDLEAVLAAVGERTKLVFLANPNNPTGTWVGRGELEGFIERLPKRVLLVLDGAYAEYMDDEDYEAGAAWVETHPNVVMTRTFSKIHGLAGLRVGWAYCPPAVADTLNRVRGPFNVNAAAQEAAVAAVEDQNHVLASRRDNARNRSDLTMGLAALGVEVTPSAGNFVLLRMESTEAARAAVAALRRQKIFVRAMDGYGLPDCLRAGVGDVRDVERLLEALGEHMASASAAGEDSAGLALTESPPEQESSDDTSRDGGFAVAGSPAARSMSDHRAAGESESSVTPVKSKAAGDSPASESQPVG